MSWYRDKEPFNKFDPEWCRYCEGGDSVERIGARMKGADDEVTTV